MARRSQINRGSEVRVKGKSMGRERSGVVSSGGSPASSSSAARPGDVDASSPSPQPKLSSSSDHPGAAQPRLTWTQRLFSIGTLYLLGRVALMLAGIAVMALGIDIVVKGNLGNSPISACPYVMSHAVPAVSFGTLMLIWQCLLVVTQIIILRKDFRLVDLLQIPVSVFFGVCIDIFVALLQPLPVDGYVQAWVYLAVGILVLALGIVMTVVSGTVMNCGEAVVQAVVTKTGARFGTIKVVFDVTCAVSAAALAFLFLGHLEGVREGTVVCALCTGMVVNVYMGLYGKLRAWSAGRRARKMQPAPSRAATPGACGEEQAADLA